MPSQMAPQKTPVLQPCLEVSAPEVNCDKYHPCCPGPEHRIKVPHQTKCRHACVGHTLTKTQGPLEPEGGQGEDFTGDQVGLSSREAKDHLGEKETEGVSYEQVCILRMGLAKSPQAPGKE